MPIRAMPVLPTLVVLKRPRLVKRVRKETAPPLITSACWSLIGEREFMGFLVKDWIGSGAGPRPLFTPTTVPLAGPQQMCHLVGLPMAKANSTYNKSASARVDPYPAAALRLPWRFHSLGSMPAKKAKPTE